PNEETAARKLLTEEECLLQSACSIARGNAGSRTTPEAGVVAPNHSAPQGLAHYLATAAVNAKPDLPAMEVPSTGARLPAVWAVDLLLQLCFQLPGNDGCALLHPLFRWHSSGPPHSRHFTYRGFLPSNLGLPPVDGPTCSSKEVAKKLACLEAVRLLWQRGDVDDHLRLRFSRKEVTRA
ncbi:hypothetical protein Agub_g10306, partial [Astrephomene gubernaculifera]